MAEILFDVADSISKVYPALSPLSIRRERFGEVLRLVSSMNEKSRRDEGLGPNDKITYDQYGRKIVWREDNSDWW